MPRVTESTSLLINESKERHAEPKPAAKAPRLRSLDIFRGLTMVGMILVDNQGDWSNVWWPLDESPWIGLHPADCIFPTFCFLMGVSMTFALPSRIAPSPSVPNAWHFVKVIRRSILLFLIGLFFNIQATNFHQRFRVMGVLQRLGIVYLVTSLTYLLSRSHDLRRAICVACLVVYLIPMYAVPVTDAQWYCSRDTGDLASADCNFSGYLDRLVFGDYMIHPTDPEGIWSSWNAIATGFLGLELGVLVKRRRTQPTELFMQSSLYGFLLSGCGFLLGTWTPVIKKLWSTSFTILVGGLSALGFAVCLLLADIYEVHCMPPPGREDGLRTLLLRARAATMSASWRCLEWLGRNPLAVFVGMVFLEVVMICNVKVHSAHNADGSPMTLYDYCYQKGFASWISSPTVASLCFSLAHLVFWTATAGVLHWRRIFITM